MLIVITVLLSTIVVDYAKARDCNCKKRNGSLDNVTFYIARSRVRDKMCTNIARYEHVDIECTKRDWQCLCYELVK